MADSAPDSTTPDSADPAQLKASLQPYLDSARENIRPILEEPAMDDFLRSKIEKLDEWPQWSEPAKQSFTHMMSSQMLQREAVTTQIALGQQFKLPAYSAIKNLGLLLQRKPLPPPPKKKRKRLPAPAVEATEATDAALTDPTSITADTTTENDAALVPSASADPTPSETSTATSAAPVSDDVTAENTTTTSQPPVTEEEKAAA